MPYVPNTSDVLNMSEDLVRVAYAEEFTKIGAAIRVVEQMLNNLPEGGGSTGEGMPGVSDGVVTGISVTSSGDTNLKITLTRSIGEALVRTFDISTLVANAIPDSIARDSEIPSLVQEAIGAQAVPAIPDPFNANNDKGRAYNPEGRWYWI